MPARSFFLDRYGGAATRLVASIIVGVGVAVFMPHTWSLTLHCLGGWSGGAGLYLLMAWSVIFRADSAATQHRCRMDDPSRGIVDVLLCLATVASITAVCLALHDSHAPGGPPRAFSVGLPILAAVLAWFLVHTLYALHYARLWYHADSDGDKDGPPAMGIDFHDKNPDGTPAPPPDYRDFFYVSLSIACTYGVTDVELNGKTYRRTVAKHGVLSFIFATIVLALAVNVITNLLSG